MRLRVLTQKFACDACTVCCEVMAAHELGKPFYARCEHVTAGGCGQYASRPQSCRDFACTWALGLVGESAQWRPDQCGLLFFLRRYADGLWLEIYEARPDASADQKRLDYLVDRITTRVARDEPLIGTRLHRHGDKIGLGFQADEKKYPAAIGASHKMSRYGWINGNPARQIFIECHEATG